MSTEPPDAAKCAAEEATSVPDPPHEDVQGMGVGNGEGVEGESPSIELEGSMARTATTR